MHPPQAHTQHSPYPVPPQAYPQAQVHTLPPPATAGQYEFSEDENRTITTTYTRARAWGVISLLIGASQIWLALKDGGGLQFMELMTTIGGVVSIVVGIVFVAAAASMESVVKSRGNDIALMMTALRKLGMAFGILIVVAASSFVGGFVMGAIGAL